MAASERESECEYASLPRPLEATKEALARRTLAWKYTGVWRNVPFSGYMAAVSHWIVIPALPRTL